jgi:hypothetical protein
MIDEVPSVVPPVVAATQATTPSPELPPGESTPPPTDAQARTADRVFTAPMQHHPLVTLLGVCTSALILRDVAVDTFDTSEEDEEDDPTEPKA